MKSEEVGQAIFETWTVEEVAKAMKENKIVLIDVRTPQEYMFEHVEGALLMPLAFFKPDALPGQSDKKIVLHCGSGARSEKMARLAIESGLARIAHMEGGFGAWKGAKLPYIGTNMATGAPHRVD
ncbi:rhodanese-like domain-containing protein [Primorskyibacter sp. 2E233]|uniref:rhodanese-like domain-containing protein n=1 Tax=Primorskyibacter sp. 2E233 TaxID=3413431 RepID=UPI003BF04008